MSYVINGCNYSYDYEELIQELKNDIEEGAISPWNIIKIVRNKDSVIDTMNSVIESDNRCISKRNF